MKLLVLVLIFSVAEIVSANNIIVHKVKKCKHIMARHGLTARFPGAVGHGIHSITLEDIRHYFKANATENNRVPTLNYDLNDPNTVLPDAQLYGFDTSFLTMGMQHLDQVMKDMDKKDFYLTNYNTLEKLIHTIHMNEVWAKTKLQYDKIGSQKWHDKELCKCVTDLKNNGILKMLPFMSLKIRYPGVTSKKVMKLGNGYADWSGNLYTYHFFNNWSKELENFDFTRNTKQMLDDASKLPADKDEGMKHLYNEDDWAKWKSGMKSMVPHDDYELAMFLYCTLN